MIQIPIFSVLSSDNTLERVTVLHRASSAEDSELTGSDKDVGDITRTWSVEIVGFVVDSTDDEVVDAICTVDIDHLTNYVEGLDNVEVIEIEGEE